MRVSIQIPAGINSDDTTFAAPWRWADGSNVRFRLGQPEVIGGWEQALNGDMLSGVCRNLLGWSTGTGTTQIAFGTHSHLLAFSGGSVVDISPVGLVPGSINSTGGAAGYGTGLYGRGTYGSPASVYFARTWTLDTYGTWLIANPRGDTIYVWDGDPAHDAEALTNAPDQVTAALVTPERQVLAFGCNEVLSGAYNPMCIRGSAIEDIEDWTPNVDDNSFEDVIEGGGRIVRALMLGSYVAVWTDTAVHLGSFVGAAEQTYRWDLIASGCGLAGPNAVVIVNQTAYWVTPDFQFYAWQIGAPPSALQCPILKEFKDNIVGLQVEKVIAVSVGQFSELWFFYPDSRDGVENTRYVAFSTIADGTTGALPWFRGQLARTAAIDAGPTQYPLFVAFDGTAYWHENGHSANELPITAFIKTSDLYLDEAERRVLARGIWPDFEGQIGEVSLSLEAKDYPQSTARQKGPYALPTGMPRRQFLAEGRVFTVTFSSDATPSFWRLGKPSFDIVPTGQR
jgi:hypothetical protein